jgi:hypothetical protein
MRLILLLVGGLVAETPQLTGTNPKEVNYIIGWRDGTSEETIAPFRRAEILHEVPGVIVTTAKGTVNEMNLLKVLSSH